jgi:hypothetical protein
LGLQPRGRRKAALAPPRPRRRLDAFLLFEQTGRDSAHIWYAANRPTNSGLIASIHACGTSPTNSTRFYDVEGAAASPFDVAAGTDLTPCSSETTIDNQPTITPTGANELVIATMGIGDGPGLGVASSAPTGAVWDLSTYSGETNSDLMENADALAHVYPTTATTEHWNWTITSNGDNSCSAILWRSSQLGDQHPRSGALALVVEAEAMKQQGRPVVIATALG